MRSSMLDFFFGARKGGHGVGHGRRLRRTAIFAAIVGACAASACGGEKTPSDHAPSPALQAEALAVYHDRCARCHGVLGKGDGPEAGKLERRPRDFSDPTWHLAMPDRLLDKVIVEGGEATKKSPEMPAHPDLGKRPDLLAALRQHLRVLASGR